MSKNEGLSVLKTILFALLGLVVVYLVHEAAHAITALIAGETLEFGLKYGFLPYVLKPTSQYLLASAVGAAEDPLYLYISAMAAIVAPVLLGAFSWVRLKSKPAQITHSCFWIAYSAPLLVFNILNFVMYLVEKDVFKQNEWDLMLAINSAPAVLGVQNGVDLNRSIALSVVCICAIFSLEYITVQLRRLKKLRKMNKLLEVAAHDNSVKTSE